MQAPPGRVMLARNRKACAQKARNHGSSEGHRDHLRLERELRAIRNGIAKASETVRDIKGAWVSQQTVKVQGGEIVEFRTDLKVSFVLE